jgi:hypothetical protein
VGPWSSRNLFCYKKEKEFISSSSETLINNKVACSDEMANKKRNNCASNQKII